MKKKIIFHLPYNPNKDHPSASQIRPLKMLQAFKNLGFEVFEVMGYGGDRKNAVRTIKDHILNGNKFDFLYSESSTMPTLLTESHHLPTYLDFDFKFLKFCKESGIKTGLFYRDIYWKFQEYRNSVGLLKSQYSIWFYKYDLRKYDRVLNALFLPSARMQKYLPELSLPFYELPPGMDPAHQKQDLTEEQGVAALGAPGKIRILYVGGIGDFYDPELIMKVISKLPSRYELVVCCRKQEWLKVRHKYDRYLENNNIVIAHKKGDELIALYDRCHVASIFMKPHDYRDFMLPFKLFEYMGREKPIIETAGTAAGDFIESNNIGWVMEHDEKKLTEFLSELFLNKEEIKEKIRNIRKINTNHTWESRAQAVAEILNNAITS